MNKEKKNFTEENRTRRFGFEVPDQEREPRVYFDKVKHESQEQTQTVKRVKGVLGMFIPKINPNVRHLYSGQGLSKLRDKMEFSGIKTKECRTNCAVCPHLCKERKKTRYI